MQQCFCVLSQSHTRRRQALVAARLGPEVAVTHGALYLFGTRAWLTHCCSCLRDHGVSHAVSAGYMYEHWIDVKWDGGRHMQAASAAISQKPSASSRTASRSQRQQLAASSQQPEAIMQPHGKQQPAAGSQQPEAISCRLEVCFASPGSRRVILVTSLAQPKVWWTLCMPSCCP